MKLAKLSNEQEAKLAEYTEKWLKIGLSTGDCDFEEAKAAAIKCYELAGLKPPTQFYLFDSPLSAAMAGTMLKERDQVGVQVGDQVWDQVWGQVGDQVRDQVGDQVRDQVWGQVGVQVWDQVWGQVRGQVWDQVWGQVRGQVGVQVWDQVWGQVRDQVWGQVWGQVRGQVRDQVRGQGYGAQDASWLSFYDYFINETSVDNLYAIQGLIELAKHTGWWVPYRNACFLQHKPDFIKWDDQKRLHCEDGPAIRYRDGLEIYSWHGTRIPMEWITDKAGLTAETAISHQNVEQRRCAAEIIGWVNILDKLNSKIIDQHANPIVGTLYEVDIPDIGKEKFLKVVCGTKRDFALPVPPDMKTAEQAQRWLNFVPDDVAFIPAIRT
jgi:hypothetical protein